MHKFALIACALVTLAGCVDQEVANVCDRRELFLRCMASLPSGPVTTQYNDWDEVVNSCEDVALKQARRVLSSQQPTTCEVAAGGKP